MFFLQRNGGPIGLSSTASLAALVMKIWDIAWLSLLKKEGIWFLEYLRYVDDCWLFLRPILEGWRWCESKFCFKEEWREDDLLSGLTDQERTMRELVKAMDSLLSFIQFEGECSDMFGDNRLPTLDTAIWYCESSNQVMFSFFEKPTCPQTVIQKDTALNESSVRATLVQEVIRRMKNCSLNLPMAEKQEILSVFSQKMLNSGHSLRSVQYILVNGVIKFNELVRVSCLPKSDKSYKPLHAHRLFNVINRKLHKMLAKTSWYTESEIVKKNSMERFATRRMARGQTCPILASRVQLHFHYAGTKFKRWQVV